MSDLDLTCLATYSDSNLAIQLLLSMCKKGENSSTGRFASMTSRLHVVMEFWLLSLIPTYVSTPSGSSM